MAFTAFASSDANIVSGENLIFDVTVSNVGSAYDAATSMFTCPVTGVYMFTVTIYGADAQETEAAVRMDGSSLVSTYVSSFGWNTGSNTVFQLCQTGQVVDVICGPLGNCQYQASEFHAINSFSGVLIGLS